MITNRFSSSGLASARVESLARIGISAVARYRPHGWNDFNPFIVVANDDGVELPPFIELLGDVDAELFAERAHK